MSPLYQKLTFNDKLLLLHENMEKFRNLFHVYENLFIILRDYKSDSEVFRSIKKDLLKSYDIDSFLKTIKFYGEKETNLQKENTSSLTPIEK
jgi:hypothetical protein